MNKLERTIVCLVLALVILVPTASWIGYQSGVRAGPAIDDLTYGPGDVDAYSYIVFVESGTYYAKNGVTRVVEYSSTNATYVLQSTFGGGGVILVQKRHVLFATW